MRAQSGERVKDVAVDFDVTEPTICSITRGVRRERSVPVPPERTTNPDELPDGIDGLKKMHFDLRLEVDVMREVVKLEKKAAASTRGAWAARRRRF